MLIRKTEQPFQLSDQSFKALQQDHKVLWVFKSKINTCTEQQCIMVISFIHLADKHDALELPVPVLK